MVKKAIAILILLLCLIIAGQQFVLRRRAAEVNELTADIVLLENRKPETITLTETAIEIRYGPGRTIVEERPPEGWVKFDVAKYTNSVEEIERLKLILRAAREAKQDTVRVIQLIKEKDAEIRTLRPFLKVQTRGLIFRPQIGIGWSGRIDPALVLKLCFWDRWNTGVLISSQLVGLKASRHLDDVFPFLQNTEGTLGLGLGYKGGIRAWIGLTLDL